MTELDKFLKADQFAGATQLLKDALSEAKIIDPDNNDSWCGYADKIGFGIKSKEGMDGYNIFWQDLLNFFNATLKAEEKKFHRGHIFFRLGIGHLFVDLQKAQKCFGLAMEEDRARRVERGSTEEAADQEVKKLSSYVMACLLEGMDEKDFEKIKPEHENFFEIFLNSFDSATSRDGPLSKNVESDIRYILLKEKDEDLLTHIIDLYHELNKACMMRMKVATVSLTGALLEGILLGLLPETVKRKKKGKLININTNELSLNGLITEIVKDKYFSEELKISFKIFNLFRNRLHPGNFLKPKYHLTDRVSATLKIWLELLLVDWSRTILINRKIGEKLARE